MGNYKYTDTLEQIWSKSVELYQAGNKTVADYFSAEDLAFLASIGMNAQEMFDFAEDFVNKEGTPDFTMLALHSRCAP